MKYYLAEACQNTFVLFDCLNTIFEDETFQMAHRALCTENRDDALVLANGRMVGEALYANMYVVGMDGSLGEFCGNGSRACASYLFQTYPNVKQFYLTTGWGVHAIIEHEDLSYSTHLPFPKFEVSSRFVSNPELLQKTYGFQYAEVIEPHIIIEQQLSDDELLVLGRELNNRRDIFPFGINVNAWQPLDYETLFVKTYERGVQRLTRSCGTGSICCAGFYNAHGNTTVITPGGLIRIHPNENGIWLNGPAFCSDIDKKAVSD